VEGRVFVRRLVDERQLVPHARLGESEGHSPGPGERDDGVACPVDRQQGSGRPGDVCDRVRTIPDPRELRITRLKTENAALRERIQTRDEQITEFTERALSQLTAQHREILRLRQAARQRPQPSRRQEVKDHRTMQLNQDMSRITLAARRCPSEAVVPLVGWCFRVRHQPPGGPVSRASGHSAVSFAASGA
jgi:hypothetical protein